MSTRIKADIYCYILFQETAPLITISDGELIGSVNYTYHEKVLYYAYRGIPFAKKPIGDLRFAVSMIFSQ